MKAIKFLVREAPFEAGEVREFPDNEAAKFVKHGVAEYAARQADAYVAPEPASYSAAQFKRDKRGSRG